MGVPDFPPRNVMNTELHEIEHTPERAKQLAEEAVKSIRNQQLGCKCELVAILSRLDELGETTLRLAEYGEEEAYEWNPDTTVAVTVYGNHGPVAVDVVSLDKGTGWVLTDTDGGEHSIDYVSDDAWPWILQAAVPEYERILSNHAQ